METNSFGGTRSSGVTGGDPPVGDEHVLRQPGHVEGVVGDQQGGAVAGGGVEEAAPAGGGGDVDGGEGFVEKQDGGARGEGADEGDLGGLPAGQGGDGDVVEGGEAGGVEKRRVWSAERWPW